MALVKQDLWRDVLGRTTDRVGAFGDDLGKAVVDELEVAIVANHDILRFQVAIDDILAVEVLEDRGDLRAIEAKESETKNDEKAAELIGRDYSRADLRSMVRSEVANSAVISEEVTTAEELCGKVDISIVLEEPIVLKL